MAGERNENTNLPLPELLAAISPAELDALGDSVHDAFAADALTPEQRLRHLRRLRAAGGQQPRRSVTRNAPSNTDGQGEHRITAPPPMSGEMANLPRPWWRGRVVRWAGMAASMALVAVVTALLVVLLRPTSDREAERNLGVVAQQTPAIVPNEFIPAGGEITFSAPQGSKTQMLLVNADGSFARPILTNDADFWLPTWSPDGKRVAFASEDTNSGVTHVYVMNADGSDLAPLTSLTGGNAPIWSPDGTYIAYQAWVDNRTGLYVVPIDRSSGPRDVSGTVDNPWHARWSPDSTRIAFESENVIYVANVSGEHAGLPRKVAEGAAPEWSPDGERIAYFAWESGDADLFIVHVDGDSAPVNLTDTEPLNEFTPVWSPDGRYIAYTMAERDGDGAMRLHVIETTGANSRQVSAFVSRSPIFAAWSADSRQIAFTAQAGGPDTSANAPWSLSIVNADGSGELELFGPVSEDTRPVWRPDWWSKGVIAGTPDTDEPILTLSDTRGSCGAYIQAVGDNLEPDTMVRIFSGAVAISDPVTVGSDGSFITDIDLSALSACGGDASSDETAYTFSVVVDRGVSQSTEGIRQTEGELTGAATTFTVLRD